MRERRRIRAEQARTAYRCRPASASLPQRRPGANFSRLNPGLRDFPGYVVGQAVTTVTNPDAKTLLILTSGYNQLRNRAGKVMPADSEEYVFVYDIGRGRPEPRQVLRVPNTYMGIAFAPDGEALLCGGRRGR